MKLKDGKYLKIEWDSNTLKVVDKKYMDAPVFINLSRLVGKDELAKGSFSLRLDTGAWANPQAFSSLVTITDSGSSDLENGLRILKKSSDGSNVGILDRYRGIAAIQLSSSVVTTLLEDPDIVYFVSASSTNAWDFSGSIHSGTIDQLATGLRHRIYNMQVSNVSQLNTTIYTLNAAAGEFNYSSNPSYIDSAGQVKVKQETDGSLQKSLPAYTYVTGIGLYSADGETVVPTYTMFCHADKNDLVWSNNPTYVGKDIVGNYNDVYVATTGSKKYEEKDKISIKNIVPSSFSNYPESFSPTTFISKIGIYDKDGEFICEDNCESLGKWPVYVNPSVFHIDTSTFGVRRSVALAVGHAWYGQWGADRQFFSALRKHFPNFEGTRQYTSNLS